MSPPLEDSTSSYSQNPNPNHPTTTPFNFINPNFNCSNDTASFATGRFSRRKYVKVKKHSTVAKPPVVDDDGSSSNNGFVFNLLSLGQTSRNGECLDDESKLGSKVGLGEVDFVFGVKTDNGVMNESESSGTVGTSSNVNGFASEVDSHLVDSLSGLNLGMSGPVMNDKRKTVDNGESDGGKSKNVDFLFPTDSSCQKEESEVKGENLNSTEVKSGESVDDKLDSGVVFGNGEFNVGFQFGIQNDKRSTVKGRKKPADKTLNSKGVESSGNNGFVFGSKLGNSFGETTQSKVSGETKTSVVNDPVKASTTNNISGTNGDSLFHSDNLFVFGSDKTNISDGVPNGKSIPEVNHFEARPTNGVGGTTKNFTFPNNGVLFGASFTGFNTPDINLSTPFTSDMFPGLGKKLEFGKTQRKVKKTKLKSKNQVGRKEVPQSFEEASGCSPMDVSPYGVAECASTSNNEDAVDAKENVSATNVSASSAPFPDVNVPARQRPHVKKYKMKTGRDVEFKTPKSRLDPSREHETHTTRENTKASDEEICDKWRKRFDLSHILNLTIVYPYILSSSQLSFICGSCVSGETKLTKMAICQRLKLVIQRVLVQYSIPRRVACG